MEENFFDDSFIKKLFPEKSEKDVSIVSCDYNSSKPKIKQISKFFRYPNIREISLIGHGLSEARNLTTLFKLRKLNLSWNSLTDISPLSRLPNLQVLFLGNNRIQVIPQSFSLLNNLQVLCLRSNPICNIGDVANLRGNSQLRSLDLSFTPIGRDEKGFLQIVYTLPQVTIVNRGEVTENHIEQARKMFGNDNIVYNKENEIHEMHKNTEIEDLNTKIEQIEQENNEMKTQLSYYKSKETSQNEKNNDYNEIIKLLKKTRNENIKLKSLNEELQTKLTSLTINTIQQEKEESSDSDFETEIKLDKDTIIQSKTRKLAKAREIIKNMDQERKNVIEETTITVNKVTSDNTKLKSENKQLTLFKEDALRVIERLQKQLDDKQKELDEQVNKAKDDDNFYAAELNKLHELLREQKEALSSIEADKDSITSSKISTRNKFIALEGEIMKMNKMNRKLMRQISVINSEHDEEKTADKEKAKQSKEKWKQAIISLSNELNETKLNLENEKNEREKAERKCERIGESYEKLRILKEDLEKELNETKKELESCKKEIGTFNDKYERVVVSKESGDQVFKSLAKRYKDLERKYDEISGLNIKNKIALEQIEKREKEIEEREAADLAIREQLKEANNCINELNEKIEQMELELSKNKAAIVQLENENAVQRQQNKTITKENDKLKTANAKLLSTVEEKINEIGKIKAENTGLQLKEENYNAVLEELKHLRSVFDNKEFKNARNSDKAHMITESINSTFRCASIKSVKNFIIEKPLRFYSTQHVNVIPESETLLEKQKRILEAVRKELLSFPKVVNFYTPTEDDLESQLEQLHTLVSVVKKMFDEREKHILEMSDVVSSQHKAVLQMSSKQPQSIINSIITSNENMKKAQEIINLEIANQ